MDIWNEATTRISVTRTFERGVKILVERASITKRETERDRERQRDRDRQTDRHRERQTQKETNTKRDRETDRQTDRQTDRDRERGRERQRERERDREIFLYKLIETGMFQWNLTISTRTIDYTRVRNLLFCLFAALLSKTSQKLNFFTGIFKKILLDI